jgi:predicted dinucleotide-binding enzyme
VKIGVIGSGDVGKALAGGFLKHGHEVMLGTRDPAKLADWLAANPKARVATFPEAAGFGELVVLAVKGAAAGEALSMAGAGLLAGKVVIDATNPVGGPPVKGVLKFFTSFDQSLMEILQKRFPEARLVKAFNSVGFELMVNPDFGGLRPTMFICGNDAAAKGAVAKLLDQFGWEAEDMGGAEAARAIEPLAMLWCIPGFIRKEWRHAFKLLK